MVKVAAALAALAALAAPQAASAQLPSLATREVPLGQTRSLAAAGAVPRFNLVGLHWRGGGSVAFRTRAVDGSWSGWRAAAPEDEDAPDPWTSERSAPGWRVGNPYWTGASDAIEYRIRGRVSRLRAHFVWSPVGSEPQRTLSLAAAPAIVPRAGWGANELIKRAPPSYAPQVQHAIVHHTAGSNSYTRAESAAIVRGIQTYHVRGNGWNDIGYNFLVDRFGQVFEGRFGGIERAVVGAHAEGFNTGSAGVAVMGNYNATQISAAARAALVQTLAWRLDLAHVDPLRTLSVVSGGNGRFQRGIPVLLRGIVGHRDTGFTTCPGNVLYSQLGALAAEVAVSGAPKLFSPAAQGIVGSQVRVTARLSVALPWTVTINDAQRRPVATGSGSGSVVDWTWDATRAPAGAYTYVIAAGPTVRPAMGTVGAAAVAVRLTQARAAPRIVSPNGDGRDDSAAISYRLNAPALVTATLVDRNGRSLATLFSEPRGAGAHGFVFTGERIPDGAYRIVLTATDPAGKKVTSTVNVLVSRTLSALALGRGVFSPNGDGRHDTVQVRFTLAAPAHVRLWVLRAGRPVASVFEGGLAAGAHVLSWDGGIQTARLPDGRYEVELTVSDPSANVAPRLAFVSDTAPPSLRIVRLRPLRLRVSEPAEIRIVADGRARVEKARTGVLAVPGVLRARRLQAFATDAAGNRGAMLRYP